MKRALVIDGGGQKGIIPAIVINAIEQREGKQIFEIFDLIVGTSTGSVLGGALASGVSGEKLMDLYINDVPKFFTKRNRFLPKNWGKPEIYDRSPFYAALAEQTKYIALMDAKTLFVSTAFNLCSNRTHFIHSDDSTENFYSMADVISWSALSAALYFGKICVPNFMWTDHKPDGSDFRMEGAVFQDGGQGTQNSPVTVAIFEMLKRWKGEQLDILSLGCGDQDTVVPYGKAIKTGMLAQIGSYIGQARNESGVMQHIGAEALDKSWDKFTFRRINATIPEKIDKLDGKKFIKEYTQIGKNLSLLY